jgi:hypothetical protein
MTNPTQPKPNPVPAILVYGTPSSPELTQASWFRAEDQEAVKAAAEALKLSVIELRTEAEKALTVGVHEGVLKGSGRMIVGSVSSEVYRRIEEYVRKGSGAEGSSKPESTVSTTMRSASEQNKNASRPGRLPTPGPDLASASNPWEALRVGARVLLERKARVRGLLAGNRQADRARQVHARMVRVPGISGVQDRAEKCRHRAPRIPRHGQVARANELAAPVTILSHGAAFGSPLLIPARRRAQRTRFHAQTSGDKSHDQHNRVRI